MLSGLKTIFNFRERLKFSNLVSKMRCFDINSFSIRDNVVVTGECGNRFGSVGIILNHKSFIIAPSSFLFRFKKIGLVEELHLIC